MSLARIAARASLMRSQSVKVAALLPEPAAEPAVLPPVPRRPIFGAKPMSDFAKRKAAGQMTLRDNLRQETSDIVGGGLGRFLKRWHGAATGKGQA